MFCNVHVLQPAPLQDKAVFGTYHRRLRPARVGKRYYSGCCIQDTQPAANRESRPRFVPNAARPGNDMVLNRAEMHPVSDSCAPSAAARPRGAVPDDDEAMRDLAHVAIHHPMVLRLLAPASPRHVPLAHVPPLHVSSVCRFMLPRKTGLASIHMMVRPMPSGGRGAARAPHAGSTDPHCTARRRQHTKSRKLRGRNAMLPAGTSAAIALASLVALAALPSAGRPRRSSSSA
jgi:hypothetical protein